MTACRCASRRNRQSRPESKRHSFNGKTTSAVLFTGHMNVQQTWASLFVCGRLAWDDVMPNTDRTAGLITQSDAVWRRATTDLHTHTHTLLHNAHHFRASNRWVGVCMCDPNGKSRNTSLYVCLCVCEGVSVFSNICNSTHESQSFWGQIEEDFDHGKGWGLKKGC